MRTSLMGRRSGRLAILLLGMMSTASCGMVLHHIKNGFVSAPPPAEFGLGPRTSSSGRYSATVRAEPPLVVGRLQSVRLQLSDRTGAPVRGAALTIDGGMPQHGHSLPTRPRVSGTSTDGEYLVQGLRFNMGGWWVLRFAISSGAAVDSVSFNVRL